MILAFILGWESTIFVFKSRINKNKKQFMKKRYSLSFTITKTESKPVELASQQEASKLIKTIDPDREYPDERG